MRTCVTGGAGFIGSHIVEHLLAAGDSVTVLDDLSSGLPHTVPSSAHFIEGSVTDRAVAEEAVNGVDLVIHLAAHRAVQRSVDNPIETDLANTNGTVVMLQASARAGVKRFVSASSSSVYGDTQDFPMRETTVPSPRSPYAVSKLAGEHYCRVFYELAGLETVSLRYFNVYGPRQRPDSAYAAVIPLFIRALIEGARPEIHGDGLQARDFTYIDDAVGGTLKAARAPAHVCAGRVYNIAGGSTHSVIQILEMLQDLVGVRIGPIFVDRRRGDVERTEADLAAARSDLGYEAAVGLREGLAEAVGWYREHRLMARRH